MPDLVLPEINLLEDIDSQLQTCVEMSREVRWNLAYYRSAEKLGLQKFITSQRHAGFPLFPLPLLCC